jgi:hypothetical protein
MLKGHSDRGPFGGRGVVSCIGGTPVSQGITGAWDITDKISKTRADAEDTICLRIEPAETCRATNGRNDVLVVCEDCNHVCTSIEETLCHLCCELSSKPFIYGRVPTGGVEGAMEEGNGEREMGG